MPDIDEIIERDEGVATTESVRMISMGEHVVPSRVGARLVNNDPMALGSIDVISAWSSPWWSARVVEGAIPRDIAESEAQAASAAWLAPLRVTTIDSAAGRVPNRRGTTVRLRTPRRLSLDFGPNVTPAFGAEVADRVVERIIESAWGQLRDIGAARLRPDAPELVAAAEPVADDAEWDDSDDAPRWLSMSDLSYRGGGLMSRRARRARGE